MPHRSFFAHKFQFTNRIAPNMNNFCRPITRINPADFTNIGQGVHPCRAKMLEIVAIFRVFLGAGNPKYSQISAKFGMAKGTCSPLRCAKFPANP